MSTILLRPSRAPVAPSFGFSRLFKVVADLASTFSEAQKNATEAHKKYPFAEW